MKVSHSISIIIATGKEVILDEFNSGGVILWLFKKYYLM